MTRRSRAFVRWTIHSPVRSCFASKRPLADAARRLAEDEDKEKQDQEEREQASADVDAACKYQNSHLVTSFV
jgi:hypothetical protein